MLGGNKLGKEGEALAKEYFLKMGYRIMDMNYRNKIGEIDIVVQMDGYIVFVEVKTRNSLRYGRPVEAIGYRKIQKIRRVAELYIQSNKLYDFQPRFDIVEILMERGIPNLNHIENAF